MTFSTTKRKVSVTSHVYILLFVYIYVHLFFGTTQGDNFNLFEGYCKFYYICVYILCRAIKCLFLYPALQCVFSYCEIFLFYYSRVYFWGAYFIVSVFVSVFIEVLSCYQESCKLRFFFGKRVTNKQTFVLLMGKLQHT